MEAAESKAAKLAQKLGLDFTCDQTRDGKFVRFFIKFPDVRGTAAPPQDTIAFTPAPDAKKLDTPEAQTFQQYVKKVTAWRTTVRPWTIDPSPPGETGIIVAGGMGFLGDRLLVRGINKKNIAALRKFNDPEAMARRTAIAQDSPQQGLKALAETLQLYGVKKPGHETLQLKAALEKAAAIIEAPHEPHGAPVDPNVYHPGLH